MIANCCTAVGAKLSPFCRSSKVNDFTTANGTVHREQIHVSTDQFMAARNTVNVTMGNNWVRGDLKAIKLHVASPRGFGTDLVFNSVAPPSRFGGAGLWYFDR